MSGQANGHIRVTIATNIVRAMAEHGAGGISTAALSRETGIHERAIRRWRNGEVAPSFNNLQTLSEALGHEIAWFYAEHPAEPVEAA